MQAVRNAFPQRVLLPLLRLQVDAVVVVALLELLLQADLPLLRVLPRADLQALLLLPLVVAVEALRTASAFRRGC
jgi:hypothetical protein